MLQTTPLSAKSHRTLIEVSRHPQQELQFLSGAADCLPSNTVLRPRGESGSRHSELQGFAQTESIEDRWNEDRQCRQGMTEEGHTPSLHTHNLTTAHHHHHSSLSLLPLPPSTSTHVRNWEITASAEEWNRRWHMKRDRTDPTGSSRLCNRPLREHPSLPLLPKKNALELTFSSKGKDHRQPPVQSQLTKQFQ